MAPTRASMFAEAPGGPMAAFTSDCGHAKVQERRRQYNDGHLAGTVADLIVIPTRVRTFQISPKGHFLRGDRERWPDVLWPGESSSAAPICLTFRQPPGEAGQRMKPSVGNLGRSDCTVGAAPNRERGWSRYSTAARSPNSSACQSRRSTASESATTPSLPRPSPHLSTSIEVAPRRNPRLDERPDREGNGTGGSEARTSTWQKEGGTERQPKKPALEKRHRVRTEAGVLDRASAPAPF